MAAYSNIFLQKAHEYPIVFGIFAIPMAIGVTSSVLSAAVRSAKYGSPFLGSQPIASMSEETADASNSLFGNVSGESTIADRVNLRSKYEFDEFYNDTRHLNSQSVRGPQWDQDIYKDTRHKTQLSPTDGDFRRGWLSLDDTPPTIYNPRQRQGSPASDTVVDLIGEGSMFAGVRNIGRLK